MEPLSCSANCLVHLHSKAGEAWLLRHPCIFQQRRGPDGISRFLITIGNNPPTFLSAHEIYTSHLLRKIANFERRHGKRVQNIVVIIPAGINPRQYQLQLSAAAAAAGVCIVLYIERSVLAASYYKSLSSPGHRTSLVFELFDHFLEISLLTDDDQGLKVKAVVSNLGCPLFHYMVSVLRSRLGIGIVSDAYFLYHILKECERAKDAICSGLGTFELKFQRRGSREVRMLINGEWLVLMNLDHLRSGIVRCLREAGVRQEAVDEIVLAGASTNIPAVRGVLHEIFQRQPFRCHIDPDPGVSTPKAPCKRLND